MAIRLYTCSSCGHKMRFSDSICHACYARKHVYQHPVVNITALGLVLLVLLVAGVSLAAH